MSHCGSSQAGEDHNESQSICRCFPSQLISDLFRFLFLVLFDLEWNKQLRSVSLGKFYTCSNTALTSEKEVTSVFFLLISTKFILSILNLVTDVSLERGGSSPVCSPFHKTAMFSGHERERHAQGKIVTHTAH